ncbi:MAG: cell division protein FtsZ [Opitutaceae bacterium]|nr:cell division protein FtsZ [Cytophagales bacterium]
MQDTMYSFDIPAVSKSIIKVIGVGGGGCNAVNHMYNQGIKDVEFIICNTDAQVLKTSPVPNKLQIGTSLTKGLGAGTNPEIGRSAALESRDEIREKLYGSTEMAFITAGMGGGTGTGAAPVIAKIAKEMDILTVGIVTMPFSFEGKKKRDLAEKGIAELKEYCDTVIIIMNDKIREIFGNTSLFAAFSHADNVLTAAAKSIAEIITMPGILNIDFADVKTVMQNSGAAVMGAAVASGKERAKQAAEEALHSPLLNNTDIKGAQKILVSIMGSNMESITMDEFVQINDYFQEMAGEDANLKCGISVDETLGESIRVTVIATGFATAFDKVYSEEPVRKVIDLNSSKPISPAEPKVEFQYVQPQLFVTKSVEQHVFVPENPVYQEQRYPEPVQKVEENLEQNEVEIDFTIPAPNQISLFESNKVAHKPTENMELDDSKRDLLKRQAMDRKNLLQNTTMWSMNAQEFKDRLEVPAYMRKKVDLEDVPHSSERNISRFNLNEESEIMGNNKFLHDNVD